MSLLNYTNELNSIMSQDDLTSIEKDYRLIRLMNELENQYQIPSFTRKQVGIEHQDAINLYYQIYSYRSELYKTEQ